MQNSYKVRISIDPRIDCLGEASNLWLDNVFSTTSSTLKGARCETPKTCPPGYCHNGGLCTVSGGRYLCNCLGTGYQGPTCTDPIACPPGHCHGGICTVLPGGRYVCNCWKTGLSGSTCDGGNFHSFSWISVLFIMFCWEIQIFILICSTVRCQRCLHRLWEDWLHGVWFESTFEDEGRQYNSGIQDLCSIGNYSRFCHHYRNSLEHQSGECWSRALRLF